MRRGPSLRRPVACSLGGTPLTRGTSTTHSVLLASFGAAPFSAAEARDAGITRRRLQGAVSAGKIRHLGRLLYVATEPDPQQALLRMQRDLRERGISAVVGGRSAAEVWGIPVLGRSGLPPSEATFWVPPGTTRPGTRHGQRLSQGRITDEDVVTLPTGLVVTSPLRTAVDVVRLARLPRHFGLASLNAGMRAVIAERLGCSPTDAGLITESAQRREVRESTLAALNAVIDECPRWGMSAVRACLPWLDPRIETALESLSWGRFLDVGVPMPTPQAWLQGASGRWWRVDFWWEDLGIIGEADGMLKYRSPRDLADEKARQLDLEAPGRSLYRWGWDHVIRDADPVMALLFSRLRAAA